MTWKVLVSDTNTTSITKNSPAKLLLGSTDGKMIRALKFYEEIVVES
jgi:hypothetical protein